MYINVNGSNNIIKLRKGKVLGYRSIMFMEKITASVLLKLFINGNETCHCIDTP